MFGGSGDTDSARRNSTMTSSAAASQLQWGHDESRELIKIRGDIERDSSGMKPSKTVWEMVSSKMREKGYSRTPDQCKCKWKNLVNRYKGKELSDPENGKDFPFFNELREVLGDRANILQRLPIESEAGSSWAKKRVKRSSSIRSLDEFSDGEDELEGEEEKAIKSDYRKRKAERTVVEKSSKKATNITEGMLKEFVKQQQRMEMEWMEMMEKRVRERQLFEEEWRSSVEKLERERLMVEQAWREKEEQMRIRDEIRAERRDALLTTLLTKLIDGDKL